MATWGERRKFGIVLVSFSVLVVGALGVFFVLFIAEPRQTPPVVGEGLVVTWSAAVPVGGGVFNAVAAVRNPDEALRASARYRFQFYDEAGNAIGARSGESSFGPGESFYIFESALPLTERPAWVAVRWEDIAWSSAASQAPEYELSVSDPKLTELVRAPRLEADLVNTGVETVPRSETLALLWDSFDNLIAASRTVTDPVSFRESAALSFTWPEPFTFTERVCSLTLSVVAVSREEEDVFDPSDTLSDFSGTVASGFSWTVRAVEKEEFADAAAREYRAMEGDRSSLLILVVSEDGPPELLDQIIGAEGGVSVVHNIESITERVIMGGESPGQLSFELLDPDAWEDRLLGALNDHCRQEPDRIELRTRIL